MMRPLLLGALLCATACADGTERPALATHGQAIIDGEASGSAEDGVVMLRSALEDGTEVLCSASLLAPNLVLTARHCVSYLAPGLFACTVRGELVNNPEGGGSLGAHLPADSIEVYGGATPRELPLAHGQRVISTLAEAICVNDLAFVVLDTHLQLPVVPLRLGRPAQVGEAAVLVGYGLVARQTQLDYRTQRRARKAGLQVAELGPDSLADGVTTVPPRALILTGPSGCVGDSGGPLLAASGAVLGVYSLQEGESCTAARVRHQLVHVPPFTALIAEAFEAANATPTLEPTPDDTDSGAGGSETEGRAGENSGGTATGGSEAAKSTSEGARSTCAFSAPSATSSAHGAWAALLLLRRRRVRR